MTQLHKRMGVWVLLSKEEEDKYLEIRGKSTLPEAMSIGEELAIDNVLKYVHHMDDQEGWEDHPVMHPSFKPPGTQIEEEWKCEFGHSHEKCHCHCELREYGQDESIYRSGDHPNQRWGLDG